MSLFLAWMPDHAARERLAALRESCRAAARDTEAAGWTAWRTDAQLHMTLRFLAHVPPEQPSDLRESLAVIAATQAPFTVAFDRMQAWASALVARTAPCEPLDALLTVLNQAAMQAGYAELETQTPHMTLAYPPRDAQGRKQRIAQAPAFDPSLLPLCVQLDAIAIVQTVPGSYRVLAQWPLSAAHP